MALRIKSLIHNKKEAGRKIIIPKKLHPLDSSIFRMLIIMVIAQKAMAITHGERILSQLVVAPIVLDWSTGLFKFI